MRLAIVAAAGLLLTSMAAAQPAERFAERHGVSGEELNRLRREERMSWGDISHALSISERSKRPLPEILERRRSGESWKDMSKRYELDYSQVRQGAWRVEREAREAGFHERHQRDRDMRRDHDRMLDGRDGGDSRHR